MHSLNTGSKMKIALIQMYPKVSMPMPMPMHYITLHVPAGHPFNSTTNASL